MVAAIAHTLFILEHDIPAAIVVGIRYETNELDMQMALRSRDYTPSTNDTLVSSMRSGYPWAEIEQTSGQAAGFLSFIRDDVVPFIDRTYRTDPHLRIGHGHSFGGLFLLYVLFNQSDTFHRYIVASPSIWWDDKVILKHENAYAETHPDLSAIIYMTSGDTGGEVGTSSDAAALIAQLKSRHYAGLLLHQEQMQGETHVSVVARTFTTGLRKLLTPPG